jgi:GNAT superfamily N-acetyltransferase
VSGQVVGYADLDHAWWTGRPEVFTVDVRVERESWGRGIGTELFETLVEEATNRGAARLTGWVREDLPEVRRFAARHGFEVTGTVIEDYRLHVPQARTAEYQKIEAQLQREGIRIATLSEIGQDEAFLRALHKLWATSGNQATDAETPAREFDSWRERVMDGPGQTPETHWVALDGERPVGMTFLKRLAPGAAENDYTGVAPSHRGRGIAQALKLQAIAWAKENGVEWFYTASEVGNARMIAINRRLGYEPGARRLEVAGDLTGRDDSPV